MRSTTIPANGARSDGAPSAKKTSPAAELLWVKSFIQTPRAMKIAQSPKTETDQPNRKILALRMRRRFRS
jgi:hypothetical protein